MTHLNTQKWHYRSSWNAFFFHTLGWSEQRVAEWVRKTGKDRLLDDYDSWLYHDPPVVWAVEALLSHVLPQQTSAKTMTIIRNEILDGFAGEDYQVSPNDNWPLHRKRINQALKKHGTQLPPATASLMVQRDFPQKAQPHWAGSALISDFDASRKIIQAQFKPRKPSGGSTFSSHRTTSHLTVRELARG